jgi:hypothetical protein
MDKSIKDIFIAHKGKIADRWMLYLNEWDRIFSPYREREIQLLEIGVHNGGSLEVWSEYFSHAKTLIGVDINEACKDLVFDDPRIKVIVGDINGTEVRDQINKISPELDIVIDDGSHQSQDIVKTFAHYFQKLNSGGIYIIEDLHASYWAESGGGLFNPYSAVSFLKRLVDLINFEHWQNDRSREKFLQPYESYFGVSFAEFDFYQLHAIEFINSLCIISKRPPAENTLGQRVVVGSEEILSGHYKKLDGTTIHDLPKQPVDDSKLDLFSLIAHKTATEADVRRLEDNLQLHVQTIEQLREELKEREETVRRIEEEIGNHEQAYRQLTQEISEQKKKSLETGDLIADQSRTMVKLYDEISLRDRSIQELETQIADESKMLQASEHQHTILKQKVSKLEHETLFYALSKSWRYTRPFRKILGAFRGRRHA